MEENWGKNELYVLGSQLVGYFKFQASFGFFEILKEFLETYFK